MNASEPLADERNRAPEEHTDESSERQRVVRQVVPVADAALAGYPIKPLLQAYQDAVARGDPDSTAHLGLLKHLLGQWERLVVSDLHQLPPVENDLVSDARRRLRQTLWALARLRAAVGELQA